MFHEGRCRRVQARFETAVATEGRGSQRQRHCNEHSFQIACTINKLETTASASGEPLWEARFVRSLESTREALRRRHQHWESAMPAADSLTAFGGLQWKLYLSLRLICLSAHTADVEELHRSALL